MIFGSLIIGAPAWVLPAVLIGTIAVLAVLVSYWFAPAGRRVRWTAGLLKIIGIAALVLCLLEPLLSARRPREGANLFLLLSDDSQSLNMHDTGDSVSRADRARKLLRSTAPWQVRLRQDFDVRWYAYDRRLRAVHDLDELEFTGTASHVRAAIDTLASRYRDRPVAGILLFSDAITNDSLENLLAQHQLPPIFPVVLSRDGPVKDIRISDVSVNQTNFETAPVTLVAQIDSVGCENASVVVQLCDESGKVLDHQTLVAGGQSLTTAARFEFRPEKSGVLFYQLRACLSGEEHALSDGKTSEVTLANNRQLVTVNRGSGPYRVLYVSGRPNWEFKFLRRSIHVDQEVQLVGLLRIAKREAKFEFRGHINEGTNPLYRGFGNEADEQAEQYDEPVLLRLGTRDESELRNGFPRTPEDLFVYDALIIDDVEAAFFTQDQLSLLQQFVSQRGGGLLMLGGQESFAAGDYQHTPVAELLPVYLDRPNGPAQEDRYRLVFTQEGLLQPWLRLRPTEDAERQRMGGMPPLHVVNLVDSIKPGATVLCFARASSGEEYPALVSQRFGRGRTLALAVGDLWRWGLHRQDNQPRDMEQAWRQTVRWLVADVPKRAEVEVVRTHDDPQEAITLRITARDATYKPLDNAAVAISVHDAQGAQATMTAQPDESEPGVYQARYIPTQQGVYRAEISVTDADGSAVGTCQTGWTCDPARSEFASLKPRREQFRHLAEKTGGELVEPDQLSSFVADLPNRKNVITEPWIFPFWHQWWIFALASVCLIGEWGLRRWQGLP